jgi:uncharacterized membrane protein YfcA
MMKVGGAALNALVGFVVGIAGGLIGLGGAELRLPYLVGVLGLTPHRAVPVNLAISLCTLVAALPARFYTLNAAALVPHIAETAAIALGAVAAAWFGAGILRRLSPDALARLIFVLLLMLGAAMIAEAWIELAGDGLLPAVLLIRIFAGVALGLLIGAISSVLGVAGGEVIIPTLVFGYGVPVKDAGSLSMLISLPTVVAGIVRHTRMGTFADRNITAAVIVPMGIGSVAGAIAGGLLVGAVPADIIKVGLGILLVWSAWKVFGGHKPRV